MKHVRKVFFFFIVVALIAGCVPAIESIARPTTTSIIPSATLPIIANTSTPSPTPNILSTPTVQPTPTIAIEKDCLTLEDQLPPDLNLTGVWIRQPVNPYLENLDENTKYRIPMNGGGAFLNYSGHFAISPNGKWLAYLDANLSTSQGITRTNGYALQVINSSGHSLSMSFWPTIYQTIYGWVDNQNLLLGLNRRDIVLNPFTGKWHELTKPDWFNGLDIKDSWFDTNQYSPNLNQIIVGMKDHSELRDVKYGNIIFGDIKLGPFEESAWSSDGIMLAIATDKGKVIHIFNDKNEVLQLDLFQQHLATSTSGEILIRDLRWSLDHQKLLIETYDESLILDMDNQKIYALCFDNKNFKYDWFSTSFFYPINGKFLISNIFLVPPPNYGYQLFEIIIDLENMHAYKLSTPKYDYQDRFGWLPSP